MCDVCVCSVCYACVCVVRAWSVLVHGPAMAHAAMAVADRRETPPRPLAVWLFSITSRGASRRPLCRIERAMAMCLLRSRCSCGVRSGGCESQLLLSSIRPTLCRPAHGTTITRLPAAKSSRHMQQAAAGPRRSTSAGVSTWVGSIREHSRAVLFFFSLSGR